MAEVSVKSIPIRLDMRGDTQIENITKRVQEAVADTGLKAGIATVFIRHTTASVMLIEDEPGIRADTKAIWDRLVPADAHWQPNTPNPGEDNAHSPLRGHLQGPSVAGRVVLAGIAGVVLPVRVGRDQAVPDGLGVGADARLVLDEHDGGGGVPDEDGGDPGLQASVGDCFLDSLGDVLDLGITAHVQPDRDALYAHLNRPASGCARTRPPNTAARRRGPRRAACRTRPPRPARAPSAPRAGSGCPPPAACRGRRRPPANSPSCVCSNHARAAGCCRPRTARTPPAPQPTRGPTAPTRSASRDSNSRA